MKDLNQYSYRATLKKTHKLAKLGSLAVYWNTDSKLFGGNAHEDVINAFPDFIARGGNMPEGQQFVLKPVNGEARIEMNKALSEKAPKMKATMLFDEIGFVLDEDQYRDALMMVDLFHFYIRHQQYKKIPTQGWTKRRSKGMVQVCRKCSTGSNTRKKSKMVLGLFQRAKG